MALDTLILSIIVCPTCKNTLEECSTHQKDSLFCKHCSIHFPIYKGIPILLEKEAVPHSIWGTEYSTDECATKG